MADRSGDFSDLTALFINTTLTRSPGASHTQLLIDVSADIMAKQGVAVDQFRAVDHQIATGVYPDMRTRGWDVDEWPDLFPRVLAADILVIGGPIWLGDNSSETKKIIERLYAHSGGAQRQGPVAVLRTGRRLPDHRQRGRHQALHVQRAVQPAAHRLQHPAAGRRRLDR